MIGCIQLCIYTYTVHCLYPDIVDQVVTMAHGLRSRISIVHMYKTLHKVWTSSTVVTMVTALNFYTLFDLPTEVLFSLILNLLSAYIYSPTELHNVNVCVYG